MSYSPKHAKPASAKDIAVSAYRGAFGSNESSSGRHARPGKGRLAVGAAHPGGIRIPQQRRPDPSESRTKAA
jgi:hypothetical protein